MLFRLIEELLERTEELGAERVKIELPQRMCHRSLKSYILYLQIPGVVILENSGSRERVYQ